MTDFTKTVTNSINCFGGAPSNKWNAYNWNAFLWGEGTADVTVTIGKTFGNSLTPSSTFSESINAFKTLSNSLSPTFGISSEYLIDGQGYSYVFIPNVTNGYQRVTVTYSSGVAASSTWSSGTAASTTWS